MWQHRHHKIKYFLSIQKQKKPHYFGLNCSESVDFMIALIKSIVYVWRCIFLQLSSKGTRWNKLCKSCKFYLLKISNEKMRNRASSHGHTKDRSGIYITPIFGNLGNQMVTGHIHIWTRWKCSHWSNESIHCYFPSPWYREAYRTSRKLNLPPAIFKENGSYR